MPVVVMYQCANVRMSDNLYAAWCGADLASSVLEAV